MYASLVFPKDTELKQVRIPGIQAVEYYEIKLADHGTPQ